MSTPKLSDALQELQTGSVQKLGKKALGETPEVEAKQLVKALESGVFTMDEFFIQMKQEQRRLAKEAKAEDEKALDSLRRKIDLMKHMTVNERRGNALMRKRLAMPVMRKAAKNAGWKTSDKNLGKMLRELTRQYQVVEVMQSSVRKWNEEGQTIPDTWQEIQQKAIDEGAFAHMMKKR